MPTEDAFAVIAEQERRRDVIGFLATVLPQLSRVQRRILLMYIDGYSMRSIGAKLGIDVKAVQRIIDEIPYIIHGNYEELRDLVLPRQSQLSADVPEVKIGWALYSAKYSATEECDDTITPSLEGKVPRRSTAQPEYTRSPSVASLGKWRRVNGRTEWSAGSVCRVPEYFAEVFGDWDTRCTMCPPQQCTRRKVNV